MNPGRRILLPLLVSAISVIASAQTVTLYSPRDPATKKYDKSRACFSFEQGKLEKDAQSQDWDLGYGFLATSAPNSRVMKDWFTVNISEGRRSVIKDLGAHKGKSSIKVRALKPLPPLREGEVRHITIDTSGAPGLPGAPGADGRDGRNGRNGDGTYNRDLPRSERGPDYPPNLGMADRPVQTTQTVEPAPIAAKVAVGHVYLVHVKNESSDYYALFRVEELKQQDHCTITWQIVEPGEKVELNAI